MAQQHGLIGNASQLVGKIVNLYPQPRGSLCIDRLRQKWLRVGQAPIAFLEAIESPNPADQIFLLALQENRQTSDQDGQPKAGGFLVTGKAFSRGGSGQSLGQDRCLKLHLGNFP